jgi:cardiolipin synthase
LVENNDASWETARLLAQRAHDGVKVRMIVDGAGAMGAGPILDFLRANGVEVRIHNPLSNVLLINKRWHQKMLIVDGKAAVVGGLNIGDHYAYGGTTKKTSDGDDPWYDTDMKIEGLAARDVTNAFVRNWDHEAHVRGEKSDLSDDEHHRMLDAAQPVEGGKSSVRFVQHRPVEDKDDYTHDLLYMAISASQKSIKIETPYFLPSKYLRQALIDAAKRGVKVEIVTNSARVNDNKISTELARFVYPSLMAAGVEIHERVHNGMLHAKTATFDDEYTIVGSMNANNRSWLHDGETTAGISDRAFAARNSRRFDDGLSDAVPITPQDLRGRSLLYRLRTHLQRPLEPIF